MNESIVKPPKRRVSSIIEPVYARVSHEAGA
jgi:hypothetical protein